jgi:hypothetical protein
MKKKSIIYLLVETAEQAASWLENVLLLIFVGFNEVIKSLLLFVLLLFLLLTASLFVDSSAIFEFKIDEETNEELDEVDDDEMLDCEFD